MAEQNQSKDSNKSYKRNFSKDHNLQKRPAKKPVQGETLIYVSTKTKLKALLDKCNKLINNNEEEIILYCLGAAIQKGILLALQLCEQHVSYKIHTNTLTTELIDDLEPAVDNADYEIQRRFNSALQIKVFKTDLLES